jgi:CubicO group peptidase (beta-lactamase class C family)
MSRDSPATEVRAIAGGVRDPGMISGIDDLMRRYAGAVPGASVLVVRDGVSVVRRAYGLASVEEAIATTPATNYRLASLTKQFSVRISHRARIIATATVATRCWR